LSKKYRIEKALLFIFLARFYENGSPWHTNQQNGPKKIRCYLNPKEEADQYMWGRNQNWSSRT
jgi:hypothetical protein